MKIVLLGANGQLGTLLYKYLTGFHEVMGTARTSSAQYLRFDPFTDNWSALGKPDAVVNCIGQIKEAKNFSFSKIHTTLAHLLIANRKLLGSPKIIQISALGASSGHRTVFLSTKGIADEYLLGFPDVFVVRPSIVCTHGTMLVKKLRMVHKISRMLLGRIILPEGLLSCKIQPVMPQDLAMIVQQMLSGKHGSEKIMNVPGPEEISFQNLLEFLYQKETKFPGIIELPRQIMDGLIKYLIDPLFPGIIDAQQYQLLFEDNVADANKAEKCLGHALASTKDFWINEFK
jgi:nucleoside-diphosphate-sugar epimerase